MCDGGLSAIIAAGIAAATSIGTTAYNNNQQKKAEARKREADKKALIMSKQQQQSVAETAGNVGINETKTKKNLSSLKIPVSKATQTVNTGVSMTTGLNIPM